MDSQLNIGSARLTRLLSQWTSVQVEPSKQDFAEKLGLWLSAFDTVKLDASLHSIRALSHQRTIAHASSEQSKALDDVFQSVRRELMAGIASALPGKTAAKPLRGGGRHRLQAEPAPTGDEPASYAPFQQRHLDQQRQMDMKVSQLRSRMRQTLFQASTNLRQLAALDAAMEQTLGTRQQRLFAMVPVFLERRFEHWRASHPADGADGKEWLRAFGREWQDVLLAELDVRLQPVMGMIEAFNNEVKEQQ